MATFFATADEFAARLEKHGGIKAELIVGYYKRGSKRPSMMWSASVDADFKKPNRRENSSQRSRAATDSKSFGGLSVQSARRRESAACKS